MGNGILLYFGIPIFIFFIIIAFWFGSVEPFLRELKDIKMDMADSRSETEYRYLKREMRRLYLRYIPFIGIFFR